MAAPPWLSPGRLGAQLRLTDADRLRVTAFATNTARGQFANLELRYRRRARCEDRLRNVKDTGLTNLPLHDTAQNKIWCAPGWQPTGRSTVTTLSAVGSRSSGQIRLTRPLVGYLFYEPRTGVCARLGPGVRPVAL